MESTIIRKILIAMCACILAAGAAYSFGASEDEKDMVRVAVLKDVETFDLSIRGRYRIIDPLTGELIDSGKRLAMSPVRFASGGIVIGERNYGIGHVRIAAQKDIAIYSGKNKQRYRNQIDILSTPKNKLLVVNVLDLQSYVSGVLYHEISYRWPMDAMEAQAVAARTYALYQMKQNKKQLYDVTNTTYSQVYGGRSAERYRTNIAVKRTRGEILTYRGEVLPAYFHSNCGGHTEDASELWKHDLPPLKGVVCGFCEGEPNYLWKRNFRSQDVQEKLNALGYKIGAINEITIVDRTNSGRVRNLKITARDGRSIVMSGNKFREAVGSKEIKSNKFEIEMKGYYFDLIGHGWGHGVRMCQWGAYGMAKKRYSYHDILKHYYPGAEMGKIPEK
jgi:stage II sporulation protein D